MKQKLSKLSKSIDERGVVETAELVVDTAYKNITHELKNIARLIFQETIFRHQYGKGTEVIEEDWDNLVILDACRYDDFERLCEMPGKLESRISLGTDSPQFLLRNFNGRELHDTVYVTANPHYVKIDAGTFHTIVDDPMSNWDSELQCVKPSEVTRAALQAHKEYPNKRLIIHYMQPHDPPLGPKASELREAINIIGPSPVGEENDTSGTRIMEAVKRNKIPVDDAYKAYRETLSIVLDEVDFLLNEIDGKTIITSDHGEMFGEKPYPVIGQMYEHGGLPAEQLSKVPWFIVAQNKDRRTIVSEPPDNTQSIDPDEKNVEEQLKALGYR